MNWILTSTGKRFDLFETDTDIMGPRDISHSLAHLCRFNDHTSECYSVAQHSCIVAELVLEEHKLTALLHDASDAYVGDMTRLLKQWFRAYQHFEDCTWWCLRPVRHRARTPRLHLQGGTDSTCDRTPRPHANSSGYLGLLGQHQTHD